jgi:HAD superfamily hydrolase (TIGR01490 family)
MTSPTLSGKEFSVAAFFDLDKTVISRASVGVFLNVLRRRGFLSWSTLLRILATDIAWVARESDSQRLGAVRDSLVALMKGRSQEEVRSAVRDALAYAIEPLLFAEALDLMATHRRNGDRIYLVSAAPAEIVGPLAELLGADGWVGSSAKVDDEGRYLGEMAFYADGHGKAEAVASLAVRDHLDLALSFAYSDAERDLPLLEMVGNPVAVNPTGALKKVALSRGWEVRRFVAPMTMTNRVGIPKRLFVVALAGLFVGGAAVASRRSRRRD